MVLSAIRIASAFASSCRRYSLTFIWILCNSSAEFVEQGAPWKVAEAFDGDLLDPVLAVAVYRKERAAIKVYVRNRTAIRTGEGSGLPEGSSNSECGTVAVPPAMPSQLTVRG